MLVQIKQDTGKHTHQGACRVAALRVVLRVRSSDRLSLYTGRFVLYTEQNTQVQKTVHLQAERKPFFLRNEVVVPTRLEACAHDQQHRGERVPVKNPIHAPDHVGQVGAHSREQEKHDAAE